MYPNLKVNPGWHYEDAEDAALALEQLLERYGISIQSGSAFEARVLAVMKLVGQKRARAQSVDVDIRPAYRTLVGVHELATLILASETFPSFHALIPHLKLLNDGSALQNIPSPGRDQATNKLFELFVGSLAVQCGSDVLMDDPFKSSGDNPDVIATLGGRRWGLACKVLHGDSPEGFIQHLEKGLDQIEHSPAEVGAVIFNLKNILAHEHIWPMAAIPHTDPAEDGPGIWSDVRAPYEILMRTLDEVGDSLVSYLPQGYLDKLFVGKKSIPGFLVWAHSVSGVSIEGRPTAASVRALNCKQVGPIPDDLLSVIKCLNWAAFTGASDRGPRPSC